MMSGASEQPEEAQDVLGFSYEYSVGEGGLWSYSKEAIFLGLRFGLLPSALSATILVHAHGSVSNPYIVLSSHKIRRKCYQHVQVYLQMSSEMATWPSWSYCAGLFSHHTMSTCIYYVVVTKRHHWIEMMIVLECPCYRSSRPCRKL